MGDLKNLNIDLGVEQYQVGNAVISVNPTDIYFVQRMADVFDKMDGLQLKYKGQLEAAKTGTEAFRICKDIDKEMRKVIDDLFGEAGISEQIFGKISLFSIAGGLPVWANLLLALMEETDSAVLAAQTERSPKLEEYLKKYDHR